MGKEKKARSALGELLKLMSDFSTVGRELIRRYVKVEDLTGGILGG